MDNVIDCSDVSTETESVIQLNTEQEEAFKLISDFLSQNTEYFFVLKGYAGTGKTYLMKALSKLLDRGGFVYCAPTNKATKVLRKTLGKASFNCKTIYSLLGIRMVADNEFLTLEFPNRPVDIRLWKLVILDESSMINKELFEYILLQSRIFRVKFLFVGDPAQLPPIEEKESLVWTLPCKSITLNKVMRFDNELLVTATHIRKQIQKYPKGQVILKSMHSANEGVWKFNREGWVKNVKRAAVAGLFSQMDHTKIVAWRNKTVSASNSFVRSCIFGDTSYDNWLVGDRVIINTPVQIQSVIVAHVDDEGTIVERYIAPNSFHTHLKSYHLTVEFDEGKTLSLQVIHERSEADLQIELSKLAEAAKKDTKKWGAFWMLKNSFHSIKYSYALTAHKSQGSTLSNVFIDSADVLANTRTLESLQCLYVGATRPTTKLIVL